MPKRRIEQGDLIFTPEQGAVLPTGHGSTGKGKGKGRRGPAERPDPPDDGVVRVARERRRGKGMTVVTGVPLAPAELSRLGKQLKQRCGSGGTTKGGVIEIQGDHRDVVVAELQGRGWTVKRVGG